MRDELWRYLCSVTSRRSEALQALHNLAAALEKQAADGSKANAPTRITAFRSLTGIAASAGNVWPAPQADLFFLSLQAIFPHWATLSHAKIAAALSETALYIPTEQALAAIQYLVRDAVTLHRLTTRVNAVAADKVGSPPLSPCSPPPTPKSHSRPCVRLTGYDRAVQVLVSTNSAQALALHCLLQILMQVASQYRLPSLPN